MEKIVTVEQKIKRAENFIKKYNIQDEDMKQDIYLIALQTTTPQQFSYQSLNVVRFGNASDAEAKKHYKSIDNMLKVFKQRIDSEPISEELKSDLKNYELITIHNRTIIVITITARADQLYDGKKYIREGADLKEIEM